MASDVWVMNGTGVKGRPWLLGDPCCQAAGELLSASGTATPGPQSNGSLRAPYVDVVLCDQPNRFDTANQDLNLGSGVEWQPWRMVDGFEFW